MSVLKSIRGYRLPNSLQSDIKSAAKESGHSQNSIAEQWLILGKREWERQQKEKGHGARNNLGR